MIDGGQSGMPTMITGCAVEVRSSAWAVNRKTWPNVASFFPVTLARDGNIIGAASHRRCRIPRADSCQKCPKVDR